MRSGRTTTRSVSGRGRKRVLVLVATAAMTAGGLMASTAPASARTLVLDHFVVSKDTESSQATAFFVNIHSGPFNISR